MNVAYIPFECVNFDFSRRGFGPHATIRRKAFLIYTGDLCSRDARFTEVSFVGIERYGWNVRVCFLLPFACTKIQIFTGCQNENASRR